MKNHENNLTKKRKRKEDDDDVNDGSYSKKHSIYVSYLNSTEVELRERWKGMMVEFGMKGKEKKWTKAG